MVLQKISRFFKNFWFFRIRLVEPFFFDKLKRKRKNPVVRLKLSSCLDSSSIPLDQSDLFLHVFWFLSQFLSTDRKLHLKKKTKKESDHSSLELYPLLLQFLSRSLLTQIFFFVYFRVKVSKFFFLNTK